MKNEIIKIADDLRNGAIETETARTLLLGLFSVSGSTLPTDSEIDNFVDTLDTPHETDTYSFDVGFKKGAKWMRNKLK